MCAHNAAVLQSSSKARRPNDGRWSHHHAHDECWIIQLYSNTMNHSPPLWQSPPHSTHLTPPNHRRWPCYHHNTGKQWQLSQTEGHFDGSRSNESSLGKKWHISVCSEAYSRDIKRLQSCWDARAPAKFLASLGWNEISELELRSRDFTQLTERDTLTFQCVCECVLLSWWGHKSVNTGTLWGLVFPMGTKSPQRKSRLGFRVGLGLELDE